MRGTVTCVAAQGATTEAPLAAWLSAADRDGVRYDTNAWIKTLRGVSIDGTSMRRRFTYRGDSLWWFTELYLHKMRHLDAAVGTLRALEAAEARHAPTRLRVTTRDPAVAVAAAAFSAARRIPVDVDGPSHEAGRRSWNGLLVGVTAQLSRLRPTIGRQTAPRGRVAAFVHTAFWRPTAPGDSPDQEHYLGPILSALTARAGTDALSCVGVGPRRHFRARRWWDPITGSGAGPRVVPIEHLAPRARLAGSLDLWRQRDHLAQAVISGEAVREAARVRGYDLWPLLRHELAEAARVQWPWSARAMDEAAAALDALAPPVVVTYAEAGGWGRALMLEARRRGVPSVGAQHGFIYRHWLNYRHEPDEMLTDDGDRGFPRPDLTLLFDGYAASYLEAEGRFPRPALQITGSPRLDELAARVRTAAPDRERLRRDLGVAERESLLVLASKFSEIRDHLPALFEAVRALGSARLVVKTHPAETAADYTQIAGPGGSIRVVGSSADLGGLLAAADAVVTMNSTVALDALVLGVPALVIGLPSNLSPFVDAGIMLGAPDEAIRAALETLLYDRTAREGLRERGAAYAAAHQMAADGRAADRAAEAILALPRRMTA